MNFQIQGYRKGKRELSKRDVSLKELFASCKADFEPKLEREPFESLVRAIAHQQLHGKAAETILSRMVNLFPKKSFPTPEDLLAIEAPRLRACGFSASKTKSIHDIAQKTIAGVVPSRDEILVMESEEIIKRLTSIYGVGRWTVEMLLIFQLGRLNIWPVDDFGVRKGFQVWKRKRKMPTAKDLKPFAKKYAPYETVVALHLWRAADMAKQKTATKKPDSGSSVKNKVSSPRERRSV